MPNLGPLNTLTHSVRQAMRLSTGAQSAGWVQPGNPMHQALKEVKKVFGGNDDANRPARDDMLMAVRKFLARQQVESFTQLKYVCYGVTVPVDPGGARLIDRTNLFQLLLELVQSRQGQAKQFRRCYQGLLAAYFGFDQHSATAESAGTNWQDLRGYLNERLEPVATAARRRGRAPEWLEVLEGHRNLLTDKPCERYAIALRAGDRSELEGVCAGLDISPTSWVWHEAVMAYVNEVTRADHASFQAELSQVLVMVDGDRRQHQLPEMVARNAVALCVARYAKCREKPEHARLRDICLRRIGNPWLKRPAWDATVKSEPARQMVESWLKRRLIKDFFELLAQDGSADLRRLDYWLKWEPQISDMWFVLGTNAQFNRSENFRAVRERMSGRDRHLTNCPDHTNNAFVMRLGSLLIIEFGSTGNACYVFEESNFSTSLDQSSLSIYQLKQRWHATRLTHNGPWERRFDEALFKAVGVKAKPPAKEAIPGPATKSVIEAQEPAAASNQQPSWITYQRLVTNRGHVVMRPIEPARHADGRSSDPDQARHSRPDTESAQTPESHHAATQFPQPPSTVGRAIWPSYAPPPEVSRLSVPAETPLQQMAADLPPNPLLIPPMLREALRYRCRRYSVTFEEASGSSTRSWVHLKRPESAPDVAKLARSIGFAFVSGLGFYADVPIDAELDETPKVLVPPTIDQSEAAPAERATQAKQLELLKKLCAVEGVRFDDNRRKGGALWVRLVGAPASSSLVAMLKRMDFKLAPGKGYYLSGDD